MTSIQSQVINKRDVAATVLFAINNIPAADEDTLVRFLELVNATGNFGPVSHQELIEKMILLKKYIPDTCDYSLLALSELLGIQISLSTTAKNNFLPKEINH